MDGAKDDKKGETMKVEVKTFGFTKEGKKASLYILKNSKGMEVHLTDFGALIQKILVPAKNGELVDVVLGHDELEGYFNNDIALGGFVGRNANRIANGKVTIDGVEYLLDKNNGENNLHSGFTRSSYMLFDTEVSEDEDLASVRFSRMFPHMEQGFPGNADISVVYSLNEDNELILSYYGVSDKKTVMNLTNHSYFNLNGQESGSILNHLLILDADAFTPANAEMIPTGEIKPVSGTPMDFRKEKRIGEEIESDYEPLILAGGYDHNYVLKSVADESRMAARLTGDKTGIVMEVFTDMPGMQLYTGNFLDGRRGKAGAVYEKRTGVCFETQFFPNACNEENFQSSILSAGEEYKSYTVFRFLEK